VGIGVGQLKERGVVGKGKCGEVEKERGRKDCDDNSCCGGGGGGGGGGSGGGGERD